MKELLAKIKQSGSAKEKENLEFRIFLKGCDLSTQEVDSIVHKLYKKYSSKIDCMECANCCKTMESVLDDQDIMRLAKYTNLSIQQFEKKYIKRNDIWQDKIFKEKPCPFLKDNLCQCYEVRTEGCKSYPHLHKRFFTSRLLTVVENYTVCPIIFFVFESLKKQIWH